jgi:hypothetical protein
MAQHQVRNHGMRDFQLTNRSWLRWGIRGIPQFRFSTLSDGSARKLLSDAFRYRVIERVHWSLKKGTDRILDFHRFAFRRELLPRCYKAYTGTA